jgi:thiol:disulfide interchange protein
MKKIISAAITVLTITIFVYGANAEVKFNDLSFSNALKEAKKANKVVMVDFYTDWCGWCKVLDRKTYSDEEVGKFADAKLVSLKINAEKGEGTELTKKHKITGFPTIIFFDADGAEVHRVVGYQEAKAFLASMKIATTCTTDKKASKY